MCIRDRYSDEEAKALYNTVLPELTDRILGGNESLEAVRSDLDLVRVLEPYGLTVRWESENTELVDSFGTVVNSGVSEEGETVWLKAVLTDGAHTQEYDIRAVSYTHLDVYKRQGLKQWPDVNGVTAK